MNKRTSSSSPLRLLAWLMPLLALLAPGLLRNATAAPADISSLPLGTVSTQKAKPNLMFVLDNSGSMAWDYMPDDLNTNGGETADVTYGYFSSQCNGVAYNPAITYTPPIKADGTYYAAASFSSAKIDGYSSSSGTVNLGSSNINYTSDWISLVHRNYYYVYKSPGIQPAMNWTYASNGSVDNNTNFYRECMDNSVGQNVFAQVLLSSLTTAQKQNYANWFSYYRTRRLMMRSASGPAFQQLGSDFRVGFTKISDTTADPNNGFLNVSDFDAAQKTLFFDRLYATTGDSWTPLRGALSKVGRYYGNRITGQTDPNPNKYSCQRNYTLLTTDGYWNTNTESGSYGPYQLNGSTAVGQQDGNEVRPMKDGASSTYTVRTTEISTSVRTETTPLNWQRHRVTQSGSVLSPASGCGFLAPFKVTDQPQRCNPNKTGTTTENFNVTTTTVTTKTYSDGTLTGTTVVGPDNSETSTGSSTNPSSSPSCSSWNNYGTASTYCVSLLNLPALFASLGVGGSGGNSTPAWVSSPSSKHQHSPRASACESAGDLTNHHKWRRQQHPGRHCRVLLHQRLALGH